MGFKALKNHIGSLATGFITDIAGSAMSGSQKDAGKVSAQLLKKSPFEIPESQNEKLRANPLSFSAVQYPLDLGTNELGHYILFESGSFKYTPGNDSMFKYSSDAQTIETKGVKKKAERTRSIKLPNGTLSNSAISIYMPTGIKVGYNQSYDADTEAGLAGDIERGIQGIRDAETAADKVEAGLEGVVGGVARNLKTLLGEFVEMGGMGDPVRFLAKRAGVAVNPRNEAFYNSPTQRTFSFTFDFWPRSVAEAEAVDTIIKIFKYNSAPGFASGTQGGVFTITNYFKIMYMFNGRENKKLNKIGLCYCTDVEVDYTPDGQVTSFADGQPVHTKLTLNFLEDRIITKRDIEEGA